MQLLGLLRDGAQLLRKLGGEQGVAQQESCGIGEVRHQPDVGRVRIAARRERDAERAEHLTAVAHYSENVNVVAPAEFRQLAERSTPERAG